jgi:hypothetical protein
MEIYHKLQQFIQREDDEIILGVKENSSEIIETLENLII